MVLTIFFFFITTLTSKTSSATVVAVCPIDAKPGVNLGGHSATVKGGDNISIISVSYRSVRGGLSQPKSAMHQKLKLTNRRLMFRLKNVFVHFHTF